MLREIIEFELRKKFEKYRTRRKGIPKLHIWYDHTSLDFENLPHGYLTKYEKALFVTWLDELADNDKTWLLEELARPIEEGGDYIYLRDIKEFVLFTAMNDISPTFIEFFWTRSVDRLLRALIIYFQYFMQVWDIVKYRADNRHKCLRNPDSAIREEKWRLELNDLRYMVAREYCSILDGQDDATFFHHMGPDRTSKSATCTDNLNFELLYRYSRRIIEVALDELNNIVIYDEMARLFRPSNHFRLRKIRDNFNLLDVRVLEDPVKMQTLEMNAPIVRELYRFNRDPVITSLAHWSLPLTEPKDERLKQLQVMYLCSESQLEQFNLKIGILGQKREDIYNLLSAKKQEKDTILRPSFPFRFDPMNPINLLQEKFIPSFDPNNQKHTGSLEDMRTYDFDRKAVVYRWKEFSKVLCRYLHLLKGPKKLLKTPDDVLDILG